MQNGQAVLASRSWAVQPFNEAELMELAAELLEVANEAELENFLGRLVRRAWRGIRSVARVAGRVLRPLGSVLRTVAKKALPFVAGAAGTFLGGPVGTALGTTLGTALSRALEVQYEALNQADREFEMARSFVRFAGDAARQTVQAPPSMAPQEAVHRAVLLAARRQIPGVSLQALGMPNGAAATGPGAAAAPMARTGAASRPPAGIQPGIQPGVRSGPATGSLTETLPGPAGGSPPHARWPRSGRWLRRGRAIVVLGL